MNYLLFLVYHRGNEKTFRNSFINIEKDLIMIHIFMVTYPSEASVSLKVVWIKKPFIDSEDLHDKKGNSCGFSNQ